MFDKIAEKIVIGNNMHKHNNEKAMLEEKNKEKTFYGRTAFLYIRFFSLYFFIPPPPSLSDIRTHFIFHSLHVFSVSIGSSVIFQ